MTRLQLLDSVGCDARWVQCQRLSRERYLLVLLKAVVRTLPAKKVKARLAAIFYAFSYTNGFENSRQYK